MAASIMPLLLVLAGGPVHRAWAGEGNNREVPQVQARLSPAVTVTPDSGTVGSAITVEGGGYRLCDGEDCDSNDVVILWDGVQVGDPVPINDDGNFRAHFTVSRSTYVGDHEVAARSVNYGEQAVATFTVIVRLAMSVTPGEGSPGDRVTVRGTGYDTCPDYGSHVVQIYWDGYDGAVATTPIAGDGTFSADVTVPGSADNRTYQLTGQCRDSGEYATSTFAVQTPAGTPTEGKSTSPTGRPTTQPTKTPTARPDPTRTRAGGQPPPGGTLPTTAPTPPGQPVPGGPTPSSTPSASSSAPAEAAQPTPDRAARGWPRPEIVDAIRLLDDPGFTLPGVALLLAILAVLAWVLIGWPAELFNRTYEENEHLIRRWLDRIRRSLRLDRIRRWAGREWTGRRLGTAPRPGAFAGESWPVVVAFSVLAAVAVAFAEPGSVRQFVVTVLGLLVAVPLVAVSYEFAIESYHRLAPSASAARLRVIYPALVIAVLCACVSRLLDFVPGYAYGLIVAYTIAARDPDRRREAIAVLRAAGLLLGLALVTWLLHQFGTAGVTAGDDTPFALRLIDTILGLITVMSLETLVIGLMPIRFLHGRKVWQWNRYVWTGAYVGGALLFVVVLIGPLRNGEDRVTQVAHIARMLWLFLGFCAGSFAFWGFFALYNRWPRLRLRMRWLSLRLRLLLRRPGLRRPGLRQPGFRRRLPRWLRRRRSRARKGPRATAAPAGSRFTPPPDRITQPQGRPAPTTVDWPVR